MPVDEGTASPQAANSHPLIGHEAAEATLLRAWRSGRFPHAWLISGPRGVGKATLARKAARFVLSQSSDGGSQAGGLFGDAPLPPDSLDTDPESSVARRIAAGGHSDFRLLTKREDKTVIQIEQTREIVDFSYMTPAEGGWKVILIDSVDDMNHNSANALLKALEEPPSKALFLLVSHAPGGLLPTIRSRCRSLKLSGVPKPGIAALLGELRPDLSEQERSVLAALGDGSPGRAIHYADQGAVDLYRALVELASNAHRLDMSLVMKMGDQLAKKGAEDAFGIMSQMIDQALQRAIKAAAVRRPVEDILPGDGAIWARLVMPDQIPRWADARTEIMGFLDKAGPPAHLGRKHVLVNAFIRLEQAAQAR
ncbi:DNA polymerase III subunit delta' [Hwanghaeella sp.]|uniref:DNA polymerase III subunit delta' n=1 Tax=Hwanghaeella sp. TaxID=2605943 RepID=UPI003CCC22F6